MRKNKHQLHRCRGFSLVELLVAMVIALVVMAGVVQSFLASKDAYRFNQELAFIQENARFADSKMGSDIRDAGNFGCRTSDATNNYYDNNLVNVVKDSGVLYQAVGIQGWNSTTGNWPTSAIQTAVTAVNSTTPPDVIILRHADLDDSHALIVKSHSGHTFTLNSPNTTTSPNLTANAMMVYADQQCRWQAIFQSQGPAPSAATLTMDHTAAIGSGPQNYAEVLQGKLYNTSYYFGNNGHSSECSSATNCSWQDPLHLTTSTSWAGAKLMPLVSNIYYIGPSSIDQSMNSLWVIGLSTNGANAGQLGTAQELVLGVDDMRIYYGVDTQADVTGASAGTPDGTANRYVKADEILAQTATSAATNSYLVWNRVSSVRVQLLLRSRSKLSSSPSQTFQWDGDTTNFTKNDGYLRQMVSFTYQLRNPLRG